MLDDLKELFKKELAISHTTGVLSQLENVVNIIDSQYLKEGKDVKNTAIDVICQILQAYKSFEEPVVENEIPF